MSTLRTVYRRDPHDNSTVFAFPVQAICMSRGDLQFESFIDTLPGHGVGVGQLRCKGYVWNCVKSVFVEWFLRIVLRPFHSLFFQFRMLLHCSLSQLAKFRFPSWRSLALVPRRSRYDSWREYSFVLGLETQRVPQRALWSLPDRIVCHRVSAVFHASSVDQPLFSPCHTVCKILFVLCSVLNIVLSAAKLWIIIHCFSKSPRLFDSSKVHGPPLGHSVPTPGPGATWKSPAMTVVSADMWVPLHGFVHLIHMVICMFGVGEVYAW